MTTIAAIPPNIVAERVAQKIFADRGNNSEAHISKDELRAIIEVSIELYVETARAVQLEVNHP